VRRNRRAEKDEDGGEEGGCYQDGDSKGEEGWLHVSIRLDQLQYEGVEVKVEAGGCGRLRAR
jgi:hypothetical protein